MLVIEDDFSIADSVTRSLQDAGYTVDVARGAGQAERFLLEQECDAALLDLDLPDKNGFNLIGELRQQGSKRLSLFSRRDAVSMSACVGRNRVATIPWSSRSPLRN